MYCLPKMYVEFVSKEEYIGAKELLGTQFNRAKGITGPHKYYCVIPDGMPF